MLLAQGLCPSGEPDIELAKLWWTEQFNVWTPIGWKNHYFNFNVLYNGRLLCEPCQCPQFHPHAEPWRGQNFLLTFHASADGLPAPMPKMPLALWKMDGGQGIQGWTKRHETPVLWIEYRTIDGIVLKFRRSADGKTLNVSFSANWRDKPRKVILHVPQLPGLEKMVVNGKTYKKGVKEISL